MTIESGSFWRRGRRCSRPTEPAPPRSKPSSGQPVRTLIRPELRKTALTTMSSEAIARVFDFQVVVRYRSGDFWPSGRRVARLREQFDRERDARPGDRRRQAVRKGCSRKRPPLVRDVLRGGTADRRGPAGLSSHVLRCMKAMSTPSRRTAAWSVGRWRRILPRPGLSACDRGSEGRDAGRLRSCAGHRRNADRTGPR